MSFFDNLKRLWYNTYGFNFSINKILFIGGRIMYKEIFEEYESEVRSYCRSWPAVFTKAKGSKIYDIDGNEYLDFFSGAGALNYGHNNDYIKEKLIQYLSEDGLTHGLDVYTTAKAEFIETFENLVLKPRNLNYKIQFPGPTGTNAVEAALKLARKYTGRQTVFALMGAFHGMTLGALSLTTASGSRAGAGVSLNDVYHVPAPYMLPDMDVLKFVQTVLEDEHSGVEKPAAFIVETVQAEGGVHVIDFDFLSGIRKLCDKHGILLIVDDIQVGCGRTGRFFSFEHAGIVPDIVTLSKSISGYGLPMSLVLLKPELDVWSPGEHNGTFRGNQPAFVTAKAGIEYMLANDVVERADILGTYTSLCLKRTLQDSGLDKKLGCEVRGLGLIIGLDVHDEELAKKVATRCFEKGLIIERTGRHSTTLKILPPLTIDANDIMYGITILTNVLEEFCE